MCRNHTIDMLKGIACLIVVWEHIRLPEPMNLLLIEPVKHAAVPLFMLIAGWQMSAASDGIQAAVRRRGARLLRTIGGAFLYYLIAAAAYQLLQGTLTQWLRLWLSPREWFYMLVLNTFQDTLLASQLWFLPALLYCYGAMFLLDRFGLVRKALRLLPVLLVFMAVMDLGEGAFRLHWRWTCNFWVRGMPCFLLGFRLRELERQTERRVSDRTLALTAVLSWLLGLLGVVLRLPVNPAAVTAVVLAVCLYLLAVRHPAVLPGNPLETLGRAYSQDVYIVHMSFSGVLDIAAGLLGLIGTALYAWGKPLAAAACSILAAMALAFFRGLLRSRAC